MKSQLSPIKNLNLSSTDIAWLAGLYEGEGCFSIKSRKNRPSGTAPPTIEVRLEMSDEDIIQRVANLVQKNSRLVQRKQIPNRKQTYIVSVGDRPTLRYLLPTLFPYFGIRRKTQVQACLVELEAWEKWYIENRHL